MKSAIITLVLVLLIFLAFASQASNVKPVPDQIVASNHPSISISMPNDVYFNLSMVQLVLKSSSGVYLSEFDANNWSMNQISNQSILYNANVTLSQGEPSGVLSVPSLDAGNQSTSGAPTTYDVRMAVLVTPLLQNLSIHNFSVSGNHSASKINVSRNSTLEINITITFLQPVTGSGELYLIQSMSMADDNGSCYEDFNGSGAMGQFFGDSGVAVDSNTSMSDIDYLYWWNDYYQENGTNRTLDTDIFSYQGADYVVFEYSFDNGLHQVTQDPFITVPGTNIFQNPIIEQQINNIANFLVQHIEFFTGGLAVGVGLLGFSYSVYRKRRF